MKCYDIQQQIRDKYIPLAKKNGHPIPSIRKMADLFKVSRETVRKAVKVLHSQNEVYTVPGSGIFAQLDSLNIHNGFVQEQVTGDLPVSKNVKFSSEQYFSFYSSVSTKLRFYTMDYHPVQKELWYKLIRDFSAIEPAIEITPIFGDEAPPVKLADNISNYDVVQLSPFQSAMIPNSKILNLKSLVEKDKLELNEFLDIGLQACVKEDFIRGLPFSLSCSGVMVINKDLVKKANEVIPDKFLSLEHFLNWCYKITDALNSDKLSRKIWGTNLYTYSYYVLTDMLLGFFINREIDTSALKKHLNIILQYRNKAYYSSYSIDELYEQFLRGEIAVFPGSTIELMILQGEARFPWTIRLMPRERSEKYYVTSLINCISSETHHKEEAWKFIKYLSSTNAQLVLAKKQANMPALETATFSDSYLTRDKVRRQTFRSLLDYGEDIKEVKPSDRIMVLREDINKLWIDLFSENKTNNDILSTILNLAEKINQGK